MINNNSECSRDIRNEFEYNIYRLFPFHKNKWRMFGNPYQQRINSFTELLSLINKNNGKNPCFISVAEFDPDPYIELIPFDFDGESALDDALKLIEFFDNNNLKPYYMISSGNGYHIYLKVVGHYYPKKLVSSFSVGIVEKLKLKSIDYHIIKNIRTLMRIPGTINEKNNKTSYFYLKPDFNTEPNFDLFLYKNNETSYSKHGHFDIGIDSVSNTELSNVDFISELHSYPCLEYYIKEKEPPHFIRVSYVSYLLSLGYNFPDILSILYKLNWIDFDLNYTAYQIKQIMNGKYKVPLCDTIKNFGYCIECRNKKMVR